MIARRLLRKSLFRLHHPSRGLQSSSSSSSSSSIPSSHKTRTRATRILDRVPRSLRPYTAGLRDAPISHIVSFLILHELTAVVPLVGLAGVFHWGGWLPALVVDNEWIAPAVAPAVDKFGRYFRRKGWFGLGDEEVVDMVGDPGGMSAAGSSSSANAGVELKGDGGGEQAEAQTRNWNLDSPGTRIVVEVAAAYAITKALLPLRLMLSVWATPWFARAIVGRFWGGVVGLGRTGGGAGTTVAAATKATTNAAKGTGKDSPKT